MERERERMTAPFVVHHVERISFLAVFFSLSLLIADADVFSLPLSLSLSPDISSSNHARPTLTYREKSAYTHSLTYSLKRSVMRRSTYIQKKRNDVKLSATYSEIRHVKP